MQRLIPLCAVLLTACAAQPPVALKMEQTQVRQRITYKHYSAMDGRIIRPGSTGTGNCMVMAMTVMADLARYSPKLHICQLPNGEGHAFTEVDGWAVDPARFKAPVLAAEEECR